MLFQAARVEEPHCIGCTKCLPLCPTGALVGAPKGIHTVLNALCTGCGGCIAVCPAACITLVPVPASAVPLQTNPTALLAATEAHTQRRATPPANRATRSRAAVSAPAVASLSADMAALAAAAREKSAAKYASKGPLRPPKALAK